MSSKAHHNLKNISIKNISDCEHAASGPAKEEKRPRRTVSDKKPAKKEKVHEEEAAEEQHVASTAYSIGSISKLVLATMIHMFEGKLDMQFSLGNLLFSTDDVLHHRSGIRDDVDKKLYKAYSDISKPYGIYSNIAYVFLANHMNEVVGMSYTKALLSLNSRLTTGFRTNGNKSEYGSSDLTGTDEDLHKLANYVSMNYDWYADGQSKKPGRGFDLISTNKLSVVSSFDNSDNVRLVVGKKGVSIDRNVNWYISDKDLVKQKIPKSKIAIDANNRLVSGVYFQLLNLQAETIDKSAVGELEEIDGSLWRFVKQVGKNKFYTAPIVNTAVPFKVVSV